MATKKAKPTGKISSSNAAQVQTLVEEVEAESFEYIDRTTETVVPHTNLTGGIKGVTDPYPEIQYRMFQGETKMEDKSVTNIKGKKGVPSAAAAVAEVTAPPIQKEAAVIAEDKTRQSATPPADMRGELLSLISEVMAAQKFIDNQVVEEPEPRSTSTPASLNEQAGLLESNAFTPVTFTGSFGTVTAPFSKVVDGDFCIALIQDTTGQFNYNPPVNETALIDLSWRSGQHSRTQQVVNAGVSFQLDETHKVSILLKNEVE